ncbi:DUF6011 domain-containing protein [Kitasatospora sp. NPDC002227]|uniref:DUF6011 domain-containing protein n=1 Tax=Kitasatospora sp. NPDC002227 TaxID=3154773 RepID=UPI0033275805
MHPAPLPIPATPSAPTVLCRRCHRPLHDPESRLLRLGPNCRGPEDPTHVVPGEQDTLPGL